MLKRVKHMVEKQASNWLAQRSKFWTGERPVVSFTFDDAPETALRGADLLESRGFLGTFYLCFGLLGRDGPLGRFVNVEQTRDLIGRRHEVACHTAHHLQAECVPGTDYAADIDENHRLARQIFGIEATSFAYPYGSVTLTAKRAAATRHVTCRTTRSGLSVGTFDAALLPAVSIYGDATLLSRSEAMLKACALRRGWLIFYTHDVDVSPSRFGCTPEHLNCLIERAVDLGCDVLPVDRAIAFAR